MSTRVAARGGPLRHMKFNQPRSAVTRIGSATSRTRYTASAV
ncbi:hypothetical protein BURMUCGD1_5871 [Burkholderia multivorans CGD1]|nr:hypothetical protein BURMUCGD1_5871 [Burkholderia multivorans CGD1]